MRNILLVEDAEEIYPLVKKALNSIASLEWVKDLASAREKIAKEEYDLILLDLYLPDGNGIDFLSDLRSENFSTPVFLLTSEQDISEKVLSFSAGADDYITKPFNSLELMARVDARLKKDSLKNQQGDTLRWGNLELIKSKQLVRDRGNPDMSDIELSSIEFKLFNLLAMSQGDIVSRDTILNEVWGNDVFVSPRSVDIYISKLRKKFSRYPS
ncbi:MAG: response regulator transcription factor, partial [Bacteriovoracaceae bacterium]|nr:response regulator transcription factor [Bacteriovoracaceae bacterium]